MDSMNENNNPYIINKRNRHSTGNEKLDAFRSNLMFLTQNFYIEGMPVLTITKQYRKYFGDDIYPEKLISEMGTYSPNAMVGKNESEKWTRIFTSGYFYDYFKIGEIVNNEGMPETMVTARRRGRTDVEMKAMAQLASYENIRLVKSKGLTNVASSRAAALSLCQACWDVIEPDDNQNPINCKKRARKAIQKTVSEEIYNRNRKKVKFLDTGANDDLQKPKIVDIRQNPLKPRVESTKVTGNDQVDEMDLECNGEIAFEGIEGVKPNDNPKGSGAIDCRSAAEKLVSPPAKNPMAVATEAAMNRSKATYAPKPMTADKRCGPNQRNVILTQTLTSKKGRKAVVNYHIPALANKVICNYCKIRIMKEHSYFRHFPGCRSRR